MALPIFLRGGPHDGARQGEDFAFSGPEAYPPTIEMPGADIGHGLWRASVYRYRGEGVDGYAACVFYDWAEFQTRRMKKSGKII